MPFNNFPFIGPMKLKPAGGLFARQRAEKRPLTFYRRAGGSTVFFHIPPLCPAPKGKAAYFFFGLGAGSSSYMALNRSVKKALSSTSSTSSISFAPS